MLPPYVYCAPELDAPNANPLPIYFPEELFKKGFCSFLELSFKFLLENGFELSSFLF